MYGVPNEDKAGHWPQRLGVRGRAETCVQREFQIVKLWKWSFQVMSITRPRPSLLTLLVFQEIKRSCPNATRCTTSFFEKVLFSSLTSKKSQLNKTVGRHVVDLHSGTSSIHALALFANQNRYTDHTWSGSVLAYRLPRKGQLEVTEEEGCWKSQSRVLFGTIWRRVLQIHKKGKFLETDRWSQDQNKKRAVEPRVPGSETPRVP